MYQFGGVLTSTFGRVWMCCNCGIVARHCIQFLLDSSGALFLFIYLMICLSQLKLRKKWVQEGTLTFKMWLHPWLPLFVTLCIVAVLVSMGINPATRLSLLQSLIAIFVIVIAYGAMKNC